MAKNKLDFDFSKLIEPLPFKPNKQIITRLDSKRFSLDYNKVYAEKPELLAFEEFSRCLSLFQKRNPGLSPNDAHLRMPGVATLIAKLEQPHTENLQDLAVDIMKELYQVPDYIDIKGMIQPRLNLENNQEHEPTPFIELSLAQRNNMRDEIQKRVLLNGLVHGSSMHIWKSVYHLVTEELNKINPDLKELYNFHTSNIGILIWQLPPDDFQAAIDENSHLTQGFNKLKFNRSGSGTKGTIEAHGINFPTLIHEINKGILDWLISRAIPKHYSEPELKYYYSIADDYKNEVWHYILSPSLWVDLLAAAQIENEELPKLIMGLTQLSYTELVELFHLIRFNKEKAQTKLKRLC